MYFIGIDLAWSKNNGSGIAVLLGNNNIAELVENKILYSNEEIINFLIPFKDACLISIDAPLVVPNENGRRYCEVEIGRLFRKFNAGAYPSNRKIFNSFYGSIRGEEISISLEKEGFKHNPYIKKYEITNSLFEVYPHPSMVVLFGLDSILKYKSKPKRDYDFRYKEFDKYVYNLSKINDIIIPEKILKTDFRKLKSKKLKDFEDKLDGIFCAYIAYYYWKNPEKCAVFGNLMDGYIMTPIFDYMKNEKQ